MAGPDQSQHVEAAIRSLITGEAFEDAGRLLDEYARRLEREIAFARGNPELLVAMRDRVNQFFAWAEARAKAQHACDVRESSRLRSLGSYDAPPPGIGRSACA